jgi:hypothetical protein
VLRLTEGVERPADTLRDYVVTPQLVECFDEALKFIRSALEANSSKASYLHGSFVARQRDRARFRNRPFSR